MRKFIFTLGVAVMTALAPAGAIAQQTLEEATDSIKNVLEMANSIINYIFP